MKRGFQMTGLISSLTSLIMCERNPSEIKPNNWSSNKWYFHTNKTKRALEHIALDWDNLVFDEHCSSNSTLKHEKKSMFLAPPYLSPNSFPVLKCNIVANHLWHCLDKIFLSNRTGKQQNDFAELNSYSVFVRPPWAFWAMKIIATWQLRSIFLPANIHQRLVYCQNKINIGKYVFKYACTNQIGQEKN